MKRQTEYQDDFGKHINENNIYNNINKTFDTNNITPDIAPQKVSRKSIITFALTIVTAFSLAVTAVHFSPAIAPRLLSFNEKTAAVFAPAEFVTVKNDKNSPDDNNNEKSDNTTTAASQKNEKGNSTTAENIDKDSDIYSKIADTPDDIAKLMAEAQKTIKDEKQIGKTSEEDYFGGGTLVTFGGVEVQSKIPDSFYSLNIESLLNQKADLTIADISKPTVLVYHSHTTESYALLDAGYYTKSLDPRTEKEDRNMVRVGDDLCAYLEAAGIGVIHDRTIHDKEYNSAYASSRKAVEKYLEEYPTIEITIDVHRDDITYENKTKVKPTAVINGKKAARMMIIAGAEYGKVENFPDWEYNLRFDLAVQKKINDLYPDLMRPILFSQRKYNMDVTRNSFLLEIGTDANTLDEACYSARLFAAGLADLIKSEYAEK